MNDVWKQLEHQLLFRAAVKNLTASSIEMANNVYRAFSHVAYLLLPFGEYYVFILWVVNELLANDTVN